jgi:hypothetical protein
MGVYLSIWLIQLIHLDKKDQWKNKLTKHITQEIKIWNNMWPWHLYMHPKHFDMEFKLYACNYLTFTFVIETFMHIIKNMYMCEQKVLFTKLNLNVLRPIKIYKPPK